MNLFFKTVTFIKNHPAQQPPEHSNLIKIYFPQFVQSAQEFLLPKLKQKYWLWFCCDGGIFSADEQKKRDNIPSHEDLNLQELPSDDRRINQVSAKGTRGGDKAW